MGSANSGYEKNWSSLDKIHNLILIYNKKIRGGFVYAKKANSKRI